jgi:hypothetical protein
VSVTGKKGVGIPVILLHDAEGGIVTVEMKDGCIYRGTLDDAQDNMNLTLTVRHLLLRFVDEGCSGWATSVVFITSSRYFILLKLKIFV